MRREGERTRRLDLGSGEEREAGKAREEEKRNRLMSRKRRE